MKTVLLCCITMLLTCPWLHAQEGPIDSWDFDKVFIKNGLGKHDIEISGSVHFVHDPIKAMVFNGTDAEALVKDVTPSALPVRDITVEAWVLLKEGAQYGGIIGYMQDNGAYEKGWLLGYNATQFNFVLSSKSNDRLTALNSKHTFKKDRWTYVVGTYDGTSMKLYINGKLDSVSTGQKGDIDYPESAFYAIGAYRDKDEHFRMKGQLHKIHVHDSVLAASQIAANYADRPDGLFEPVTFKVQPTCQFTSPSQARIAWQLNTPGKLFLDFGPKGEFQTAYEFPPARSLSAQTLEGLKARTAYQYRFRTVDGSVSETFELETAMNYCVPDVPDAHITWQGAADLDYARIAQGILDRTAVTKGYCVILGSSSGRLAYELAKRSDLRLICLDDSQDNIDRVADNLIWANVYGGRITVRKVESLDALPLNQYFANLIVSESPGAAGQARGVTQEIRRVLVPGHGHFVQLNKMGAIAQTHQCPPLLNGGVWTHQYGDASNSANSGTKLTDVSNTSDLQVAWLGYPGADFGIDRNPRMPAPLAVNGRLFHQGLNRMIALDSFNGSVLWSLELPTMRRVNIPRDASNWCANDDTLFVEAGGQCVTVSQYEGQVLNNFQIPDAIKHATHHWGYLGVYKNTLYGSSVKKGATYKEFWGGVMWYDKPTGLGTGKVISDDIFACDPKTGKKRWLYARGSIINTTITIANNAVYFIECRHSEINQAKTGRIESPALWQQQYMVALDAATGRLLWENPIDTADGTVVFFMSYGKGKIVVASSTDNRYHLYAYEAATGKPTWHQAHKWPSNNHSGHMQHHVIAGNAVYLEPCGYDLSDGKLLTDKMGRHEGCATYAAADELFVYRGTARCIALWDSKTNEISNWTNLRPSCWLSVMFANGMLLAPEGGGGCSCGRWFETSLGFIPMNN
ncbi:MAG: PQQ-binding-like beta-propeller repeat protein [Phycisphaeraceae bacterium]|nr:PQQ-binding-like beta-propeller repeat protein [Phycisphaeraceae bacterium]